MPDDDAPVSEEIAGLVEHIYDIARTEAEVLVAPLRERIAELDQRLARAEKRLVRLEMPLAD
jgi:hypothetical protein